MNCLFINEHLIEYLEDQLDQDKREQFGSHLASCDSCNELVTQVGLTYELASKSQAIQVSDDFVDTTVKRLNHKEAKVIPLFYQALKPIAVAASIALGIIIGNGELTILDSDLSSSQDESYMLSATTPADYSVWQSLDEEYGNED